MFRYGGGFRRRHEAGGWYDLNIDIFLKNSISDEYCEKQFGYNIPEENIHRVFIGRRSFVSICKYIDENEVNREILKTIYSDVGIRVAVKELAKKFFDFTKNSNEKNIAQFPYRIVIFDDILIYGRTLGGLLSACEEIFADTYFLLEKYSSNYSREELYNIFLSFVKIDTVLKNKSSSLLKTRYQKCIIPRDNYCEPKEWRKISYEIAESTFYADIPNAAFIPALKFMESFSKADFAKAFAECQSKGLLSDFKMIKNNYRGRKLDSYIAVFSENDTLKFVFTVRCTEKYIIPFVFLPALNDSQYDRIMETLFRKYPLFKNELKYRRREWSSPQLNIIYTELINMIVTTVFLRAFLAEFGSNVNLKSILANTTANIMEYNYAHDREIKSLLESLLNYEKVPLCSLSEMKKLLSDTIGLRKYIFKGISDITLNDKYDKSVKFIQRTERRFEKAVFDYGITSEKSAYNMMKNFFSPNYSSMSYFSLPSKNLIGNILQKIYSYEDSWVRRTISLNNTFAYLLQMMDSGCMSLTVGKNDGEYIQCLKTGEQSLNMLIYRYAQYLPLLNEIQWRCKRQGRNTPEGLYYEFNYFFDSCHAYGEKNHANTKDIESIRDEFRLYLIYIVCQLYNSGQSCEDYMYLVDKKLADLNVSISPKEYIQSWKNLYFDIVY